MNWHRQRRRAAWARALLLALVTLVLLMPLVWTLLASFGLVPNNNTTPPTWTFPPTLAHYEEIGIAEPSFWQELLTSAALALTCTLLTVAIAFLAAYGLARARVRSHRALLACFLILASIPVMAYIIPLSELIQRLKLTDTFLGILLPETAIFAPLAVYVLYGYLIRQSPELEQAARLEGASLWQIIWQIVLPAVMPGVAATAVIIFVLSWNQTLIPLVLSTSNVKTIPVAMTDFFTFERELEWGTAAAALLVSFIPLAVLVILAHRVVEGFTLSSIDQMN